MSHANIALLLELTHTEPRFAVIHDDKNQLMSLQAFAEVGNTSPMSLSKAIDQPEDHQHIGAKTSKASKDKTNVDVCKTRTTGASAAAQHTD